MINIDKILVLIIAAAIFAFLAIVVITMTSSSIIGVNEDAESTQNAVICNQQAENWEEGDIVKEECLDQLPDEAEADYLEEEYAEQAAP